MAEGGWLCSVWLHFGLRRKEKEKWQKMAWDVIWLFPVTFRRSVKFAKVQHVCTDIVVGTRESEEFWGLLCTRKKVASAGLSTLGWQGQSHCRRMLLGTAAFSWCFARSHSQRSIPGQKGRLEHQWRERNTCLLFQYMNGGLCRFSGLVLKDKSQAEAFLVFSKLAFGEL